MNALLNTFTTYFYTLLHPIKTFDFYEDKENQSYLSFFESLGCSWVMVTFNALIRLIMINFVLKIFFDFALEENEAFSSIINQTGISSHYLIIFSSLFSIFIFPFFSGLIAYLWILLFKCFALFLKVEGDYHQKSHDIVSISLSSYGLYLIPFFGEMIQKVCQYYLMFTGLKKEFKIGPFDAICILLTPLLLLGGISFILTFFAILFFKVS